MRIVCYFVEPAAYTLDLATNVYNKNNIDHTYLYSYSLAESDSAESGYA